MHHRGVYLHDFIRDLLFSAQKKSLFPLKVLLLHAHCIVGLSWNTVKGDEHRARSLLKAKVFWFSGTLGSGAKTWISSLLIPNHFFVRQSNGNPAQMKSRSFCQGWRKVCKSEWASNVWVVKKDSKRSSVLLLCLVSFFATQTLVMGALIEILWLNLTLIVPGFDFLPALQC